MAGALDGQTAALNLGAALPTTEQFRDWLDGYRDAFLRFDPSAAGALFGTDVIYVDSPFADPVRGRPNVERYWARAGEHMAEVEFGFEVLAVAGDVGIARVRDRLTRTSTGRRSGYDGIFLCRFDADLRCVEFREWWVQDPVEPPPLGGP